MKKFVAFLVLFVPLSSAYAQAAPPADPGVPADGYPIVAFVTCYAPGAGGNMEGRFETSRKGLNGAAVPCTLDDFRLKTNRCWYVSLAGSPINQTKLYNMGTIDYISIIDNREYTMTNVVGYVHDTGSAFRPGSCSGYSGMCAVLDRHFDIAYGDFSYGGNVGLVNKSPFCASRNTAWKQIGGEVTGPSIVTAGDYVMPPEGMRGFAGTQGRDPNGSQGFDPRGSAGGGRNSGGSGATNSPQGSQPQPSSNYPQGSQPPPPYNPHINQPLPEPVTVTNLPNNNPLTNTPTPPVTPAVPTVLTPSLGIVARTRTVGSGVFLAWTSLNMDPGSCKVLRDTTQLIAQTNEGSQLILSASASTQFSLVCSSRGKVLSATL